jgi:hypothetical protein
MGWKITLIALVGLLAVFGLTGCCPWLGEQAAEEAIEQSTGGEVEIDDDGESVSIDTEDGSMEIQGGDSAEVPSDFPSSMPVYDGDIVMSSSIETGDGTAYTIGIETGDSVDDVASWYESELESNGWTISGQFSADDAGSTMHTFVVEGGDGQGTVIIGEEDGKTAISISVTSESM